MLVVKEILIKKLHCNSCLKKKLTFFKLLDIKEFKLMYSQIFILKILWILKRLIVNVILKF